jgi:DNA-binding transcriptional regulator GbsR (MarR family)
MELELMFSDQKWNILKCLSEGKYSPIQLAEKLNTTMANISQQMRLLEAANLVKKEKIKNRDKGKPRALFSLSDEFAYMIPTMKGFAQKKLIKVNDHQKIMLKIWFIEDASVQNAIERAYLKLKPWLKDIKMMVISGQKELIVVSDNPEHIKKLSSDSDVPVKIMPSKDAEKNYRNSAYSDPKFTILHVQKNSFFDMKDE